MDDYTTVRIEKNRSKFRKVLFVLALVCLLCSREILAPVLAEAASKKKVHKAYEKILSSIKT